MIRPRTRMTTKGCRLPLLARRIRGWVATFVGCTVFLLGGSLHAQPASDSLTDSYAKDVRPLLTKFCHRCHRGKEAEAEVDLAAFSDVASVRKATRVWLKVAEMVESGQMPPRDARQPSQAERERLLTWVRGVLKLEARARAGDPGRVVLRRLSNAEYTYTIRDLTRIDSLNPAKEFPVDGAAGEGFTNTGAALSMSPVLVTKYLQAARVVAEHAVLLPDGLAFSPSTTRRNWTNEKIAAIRAFYSQYTVPGAADPKGTNFYGSTIRDRSEGGVIPLEKYLRALRRSGESSTSDQTLSPKYIDALRRALEKADPSPVLDPIRARWRSSKSGEEASVANDILAWQRVLWQFNAVGHIGKVKGPKSWLEPVSPLRSAYDAKLKMPSTPTPGATTFYLMATDAGDGDTDDYAVWNQPKFVAPGKPDIFLKDVRSLAGSLQALRTRVFAETDKYLVAADHVANGKAASEVAKQQALDSDVLKAWLDCLGILSPSPVKVTGHFKDKIADAKYPFVKGWGSHNTPLIVTNASDQHVRIPGNLKARSIAVHPSPTLDVAVAWQSPVSAKVQVSAKVAHAHPECGNGVTWAVEHRRGETRHRLAAGVAQGAAPAKIEPIENLDVQAGDLLSIVIGPRDGNHACDLTAVDLTIHAGDKVWNLAADISEDVHTGNPHADGQKNPSVWHFYTEASNAKHAAGFVIPKDSTLDRWRRATTTAEKARLAGNVQRLLEGAPPGNGSPDALMVRQLSSLNGPLLGRLHHKRLAADAIVGRANDDWGLEPARFGLHPDRKEPVDSTSLCVKAPSILQIRVPNELVEGYEFTCIGTLHAASHDRGSVQLRASLTKPELSPGLLPSIPLIVADKSAARARYERAFEEFRSVFPAALCYTKIVPVDEVVTLTIHYREDDHLCRLFLDEEQKARLDRLWDELHYVSQDALALVDGLEQLIQFATQDADPKVFEPLRQPFRERADAFRKRMIDTEPRHVNAVLEFAGHAYRRPLAAKEKSDLTSLYQSLRKQAMSHDDAIRLTLARVLVAPAFLYRLEVPGSGSEPVPVADHELASRLSYFLWSSAPDDELTRLAAAGKLRDPDLLVQQAMRMLKDARIRRLAIEFGCQWLHIRGFDEVNDKSERHFPTFAGLRGDMYEESIRFFEDLFRRDRSMLDILDADDTFLNEALATHYGIPGLKGNQWQRVEGMRKHGRGGILGQATTLASQSGASRTSPILRGNWIAEVLLGEKLPRPPKGVPQLPDDETKTEGLTVRQLVERHSSDARCAVCHQRIDAYGFALEGFDAIGRRRTKDLGDRPIDTRAKAMDGAEFDGLNGVRHYLLSRRKDAFVRQFCKKLLGYAVARGVQIADEPLLEEMQNRLQKDGFRVTTAIEAIVRSQQFRYIRGVKFRDEDERATLSEPRTK